MNTAKPFYLAAVVLALALTTPLPAFAANDKNDAVCKVTFSVATEDTLSNVKQGLSKKDAEWFQKKIHKKYPDVCYAQPGSGASVFFFIIVTPDAYHGTRVETTTSTHDDPVSGTVTDQEGNTANVDGTVTTTTETSAAVPYTLNYGIFTLTIETAEPGGKWKTAHRFEQKGLYTTFYGIPLGGKGYHPLHAVIEEAAKWVHQGGLSDPLQMALPPTQ